MAPLARPYDSLIANSNLVDPAGAATVAGAGNGFRIPSITAGSTRSFPEQTLLRVSNASGGSGTVTVKAGPNPPALAGGQGDLVTTVANSTTQWVGPFESGRFIQSDGSLLVESSVVVTVTAFLIPAKQ
jgi:hypothetical protein